MKKCILALMVSMLLMAGCQESQVQKTNPKQDINKVLVKLQGAYAKGTGQGVPCRYDRSGCSQ